MRKPADIPDDIWVAAAFWSDTKIEESREQFARAILAERRRMEGAILALRAKHDTLRQHHGTMAQMRMDAERKERDIARDRDHWRDRAHVAEAHVKSLSREGAM